MEETFLQYANDTMFMLRGFELVTELKVNFFKSKFSAYRADGQSMRKFVSMLNYRLTKIRFSYLGLPIGPNPHIEKVWEVVLRMFICKKCSLFCLSH